MNHSLGRLEKNNAMIEKYSNIICVCVLSCSVVSDSPRPHGLQPGRLLCPWETSGKNIGVSCYSLLPGDLPDPGIKPGSPALQADALPSEPLRKPHG